MSDTDATPAQDAPEAPQTTEASDAPVAEETAAGEARSGPDGDGQGDDELGDADEDGDELGGGDTFPRRVVEKLRKQNAVYRDRAKAAEQTIATMQRQAVEQAVTAAGLKPAALWAVTQLDALLGEDGTPDAGKIKTAVQSARDQFGIEQQRRMPARPGAGSGLHSVPVYPNRFATRGRRRSSPPTASSQHTPRLGDAVTTRRAVCPPTDKVVAHRPTRHGMWHLRPAEPRPSEGPTPISTRSILLIQRVEQPRHAERPRAAMTLITTVGSAGAWSPDKYSFAPGDVVPEALILKTSTVSGEVDGDEPALRVAYVDDTETADYYAEGTEIVEDDRSSTR